MLGHGRGTYSAIDLMPVGAYPRDRDVVIMELLCGHGSGSAMVALISHDQGGHRCLLEFS